jgi:hypothetical protein
MRMKEWKKKKRKRKEEWQEVYERDESSERKNKSVRKDVTLLRDETFILFPTMCNPTRTSSVPHSHNFHLPLHMSTVLNLLILDIPTYGLFSWSLDLKGKQQLEEVLSLTIFVLIAIALPIAPLYMLYERLMGGESFIKLV